MTEQPEEEREPRLQDTTERSALPLPLPEGEAAQAEPPPAAEPAPPADVPPAEEAAPAEEVAPADKSAAVEQPASADESPAVEEPVASPNGAQAATPPPFDPYAEPSEGPRPEMLIGAAFVGGLALAFLIKRLGR